MRVISKSRLREFWQQPGHDAAEGPLRACYTHVSNRTVSWQTWADVKAAFANASMVGNCVVFNVGENKYRLIARVLYPSQKVFILKVMTHEEYDLDKWKEECGCFEPPPKPATKKPVRQPKRPKRKRR